MVEDGGCYVVGPCKCPRSRPRYLPALADALDARTIRAHLLMGRPIAPASMHQITRPRRCPWQLVNRVFDPMPNCPAFHVAFGHQFIGTLGGM